MSTTSPWPSHARRVLSLCLLCALPATAEAQRASLASPGGGNAGGLGQTTRFDNEFNPAISLSFDIFAEHNFVDSPGKDFSDLNLRRLDILAADWIDPSAFAWATVAYEGGDGLTLDEAAIEYMDLPGNQTLRLGRFFVDFGKQMQKHLEELETSDRPLVLRTYLGEELPADGVQWDNWFAAGDETVVRYSIGAFSDLGQGHEHDHGGGHGHGGAEPETRASDFQEFADFGLTGRITALTELGENSQLQVGASLRYLPEFTFESDEHELEQDGQSNSVFGFDLSYAWTDPHGIESWTLTTEALLLEGDIAAEVDDAGTPSDITDDSLQLLNDNRFGAYVGLEHRWSQTSSAGVLFGFVEEAHEGAPEVNEYDVHYNHYLSEFLRLRLSARYTDYEDEDDSLRVGLQLTAFVGPHGHGLNW